MDYAIQLLAIVCLFTFAGLWLKDNAGLPMWGVVLLFFLGVTAGMLVIYKRGQEEAEKLARDAKTLKPGHAPPDDDPPLIELGVFGSGDDNEHSDKHKTGD